MSQFDLRLDHPHYVAWTVRYWWSQLSAEARNPLRRGLLIPEGAQPEPEDRSLQVVAIHTRVVGGLGKVTAAASQILDLPRAETTKIFDPEANHHRMFAPVLAQKLPLEQAARLSAELAQIGIVCAQLSLRPDPTWMNDGFWGFVPILVMADEDGDPTPLLCLSDPDPTDPVKEGWTYFVRQPDGHQQGTTIPGRTPEAVLEQILRIVPLIEDYRPKALMGVHPEFREPILQRFPMLLEPPKKKRRPRRKKVDGGPTAA